MASPVATRGRGRRATCGGRGVSAESGPLPPAVRTGPLERRSEAGSPSVSPAWPRDRLILQNGQFQSGRRTHAHTAGGTGHPTRPGQVTDLATLSGASDISCPQLPLREVGAQGVSAWFCPSLQGGPTAQKHLESSLTALCPASCLQGLKKAFGCCVAMSTAMSKELRHPGALQQTTMFSTGN